MSKNYTAVVEKDGRPLNKIEVSVSEQVVQSETKTLAEIESQLSVLNDSKTKLEAEIAEVDAEIAALTAEKEVVEPIVKTSKIGYLEEKITTLGDDIALAEGDEEQTAKLQAAIDSAQAELDVLNGVKVEEITK